MKRSVNNLNGQYIKLMVSIFWSVTSWSVFNIKRSVLYLNGQYYIEIVSIIFKW